MTQERFEELMVKVVDGVATPAEREELMTHISGKDALERELEEHIALKAVTDGWVERLELDVRLDQHRSWETGIGLTLLLIGISVLTGYGLVELMIDPTAPLWVKLGTSATVAGCLVLLFGAIRWRIATSSDDRYSEVIR